MFTCRSIATTVSLSLLLSGCDLVYRDEDFESYHDLSSPNPYPFHQVDIYQPDSGVGRNDITVLNSGITALQTRIDMILRAHKTIEVEYFIFSPDMSEKKSCRN